MNYIIKKNIRILIIGDIMLDHYINGSCTRISPEAPVQVVEIKNEQYTLGGAGNVLKNLLSLNCDATIISVVGNDSNAQIINDKLIESGVSGKYLVTDIDRHTTIKSRVLVSNHQLIRLDKEDTHTISDELTQKIITSLKIRIQECDIVLLSDYNKGLLSKTLLQSIFDICQSAGIKVLVDPKGDDFCKYKGVNIIKPNKKEATIASGIIIKDRETLKMACEKIKTITNCEDVIVTMSEEGIAFYSNDVLTVIPTKALDVVDVTGAGDTVLASLGIAIASGLSLMEACDFANHAAAVVVSKVGSATATLEEVEKKFKQ